jgi:sugar porter (SP) family MFS transporter
MLARSQLRIIVVASLAGLLFGFDTAVISGVTQDLRNAFSLTPAGLGIAVSTALWGTLLGALTLGRPGDQFGSREVLKFIGLLYFAAALGCALAWNLPAFLLFRFLIGVAIGGSSVLAPVYIAEASPAARRGALVGLFQINIVIGILVAYISNFIVAQLIAGPEVWRCKLAIAAIPALVFLLLLFFIPQSPRWLIYRGRFAEAAASLKRLGSADPAADIETIRAADAPSAPGAAGLSWRRHGRLIALAIGMGMFNQLSGINAILYYLGDIFGAAGFSSLSANLQSIVIGATNLLATIVAMTLIDRTGRKRLLLFGSVGMALAQGARAAVAAAGCLHCVVCDFTGCGDLGLSERNLSDAGACPRTESRQRHALDHERADLGAIPGNRSAVDLDSIRVLQPDDAAAVPAGAVVSAGNQGRGTGADGVGDGCLGGRRRVTQRQIALLRLAQRWHWRLPRASF